MGRILLAKFFEVGKLNFGSIFVTKAQNKIKFSMGRILLAKFFEVGKLNFGSIFVTKAHHIFAYSLRQGKE